MKRKFLCVFFMLAGAASLAGTILLSRGRSEHHDASPAYALIFLSFITIAVAAFYFSNELGKHALSRLGKVFLWILRAVIVLATLAGMAFIVITLFPVNSFLSLILSFIAISIAALMIAAWRSEGEPDELEVSAPGTVFLWVFRALSVLAILADLAFIVLMWFLTGKYDDLDLQHVILLMAMAVTGILGAALSFKLRAPVSGRGVARAVRCIPIAVALAVTAALGFVYMRYMPKYSPKDGINILRSDEGLAQKDVMGSYETTWRGSYVNDVTIRGKTYYDFDNVNSFGGNPFYKKLYSYNSDLYSYDAGGLHIMEGYILFDPATGAHEYRRTEDLDKTYSSGDWPEFIGSFMYGKDGQRNAVLNLYFRERWGDPEAFHINLSFFDGSSEWDAKMKDVLYPHNFPEDEARAFLRSIGEETLKTTLLEQIEGMDSTSALERKDYTVEVAVIHTKDKTVEVYFFGIDIATYQNGEIVLKL